MAKFSALKNGTTFNRGDFNRRLLDALTGNSEEQKDCVESLVNDKVKWTGLSTGKQSLPFEELIHILKGLNEKGFSVDTAPLANNDNPTPLSQKAFYDSLKKDYEDIESLQAQFEILREKVKGEHGFLRWTFSLFSNKKPVEHLTNSVAEFEEYCRKNKITFNDVEQSLELLEDDPETRAGKVWKKIKDFRFLVAAAGGGMIGAASNASGVNILEQIPHAEALPGLFINNLGIIAVPFICLSIFRAFSEKSILEEAGTLGRFTALMGLGVMVGLGVTTAMSGFLPDISTLVPETLKKGSDTLSPADFILPGIAISALLAGTYKMAKDFGKEKAQKIRKETKGAFRRAAQNTGDALSHCFNKASGIIVNKHTAPTIKAAGKFLEEAGHGMDKFFHLFMNGVGVPAVTYMMANTISTGGISKLAGYAGYYGSVVASMATCATILMGAAYTFYGCRKKEFKEIATTATTAFSISSSAATMPFTKKSLEKMGVSAKTRNAVVPLGANFDMMGTALYLGGTASAAMIMFGLDPTLGQMAAIMGMSIATAFGAPGAPASTIIFLDPVLDKVGLTDAQTEKIFGMVLPADRILLDPAQTSLNVTGDIIVALDTENPALPRLIKKLPFNTPS